MNGVCRMEKITIIGDIMVEPPFMQQVEINGDYDFKPSFAPLKTLFAESDYVIGNLETPLAGPESGYTRELVSFNSPDVLVEALQEIGINAVSTANNHSLDRGYEGLARTIDVLDRYGMAHTGTYKEDFVGERVLYFTAGDTKLALIACTFSTNYGINRCDPEGKRSQCINMIHPITGGGKIYRSIPTEFPKTLSYVEELVGRKLTWEESTKLKRVMGMPKESVDEHIPWDDLNRCFKRVEADYREAREKADIVLFYPHSGGQFNIEPGNYTKTLVKMAAELGFDGIFAGHSHTSQRAEYVEGKPSFYSMGNVSMSPGTFYSVPECLPEYGLAAHLYIDEKKIQKVTFSVFKMVQEEGVPMRIIPVHELYATLQGEEKNRLADEVNEVCGRVTGRMIAGEPRKEYSL